MSRTDQHDPFWVKTARYGVERHNHEDGACNLSRPRHREPPLRRRSSCELEVSAPMWNSGLFPRSKSVQVAAKKQRRRNRQAVRVALDRGDYDSAHLAHRDRHGAIWDCE